MCIGLSLYSYPLNNLFSIVKDTRALYTRMIPLKITLYSFHQVNGYFLPESNQFIWANNMYVGMLNMYHYCVIHGLIEINWSWVK